MDWKRERDALIAQTHAFVQLVAGKKEDSVRAAEARLESPLPRVAPLEPPLEVRAAPVPAARMPIEAAPVRPAPPSSSLPVEPVPTQSLPTQPLPTQPLPSQPSPTQSLPTEPLPEEFWPIAPINASEPPRVVQPVPLGIQNEVKSEIQARIANFRAHQDRFNRERAEYFSATLARLRAALEQSKPRRSGQIIEAREPLNGRSSPGPATNGSETPAGSRSSGNGRGPS
jgi:hypothetical protein